MRTLTESMRRDGVMTKGEWRGAKHPVSGKRSALVCCPGCGKICSLLDHTIGDKDDVALEDSAGVVVPSLVCPFDCGFHKFVRLDGWRL